MKPMKYLFIVCALVFTGCATEKITQQNIITYGAKPIQYETKIKEYFNKNLPSPHSIQYQKIDTPIQCHASKDGTEYTDGWCIIATINAQGKNGQHAGWQDYGFVFRGEELLFVVLRDYKKPTRLERSK